MIGRGLRLYKGKKCLTLIDCAGASGRHKLCTAPTLLGLDYSSVPLKKQALVTGMLTQMQETIELLINNTPRAWILNVQKISLWAENNEVNMRGINWKQGCDGSFTCSLGNNLRLIIDAADNLGKTSVYTLKNKYSYPDIIAEAVALQDAFDIAYEYLNENYSNSKPLWDKESAMRWGKKPISERQLNLINRMKTYSNIDIDFSDFEVSTLNQYEASIVIDRLMGN